MNKKLFHSKGFVYLVIFFLIWLISNESLPGKNIDIENETAPVVRVKKAGKPIPAAQKQQFDRLMTEGKDLLQNEMNYQAAIQKFNEALQFAVSAEQKSDVYFYVSLAYYAQSGGEDNIELTKAIEMLISLDYHRSLDKSLCPPKYIEIFNNLKNRFGALKILSQPPEADVYLNNAKTSSGKTPLTIGYKPGKVRIRIKKGNKKKEDTVEVVAGKETTTDVYNLKGKSSVIYVVGVIGGAVLGYLIYTMAKPKSVPDNGPEPTKTGNIYVESEPSAATIFLDGTNKGTTPNTISNVSVGSHNLKLVLELHGEWEGDVTVLEAQTTDVKATLNPYKYENVLEWGSQGGGNGQFDLPNGVAVDGNGNVYVADVNNNRIQKFNSNGNFLAAWTGFNQPRGVAVDQSGNVYVTEQHRVRKFSSSGQQLSSIGSLGSKNGEFNSPMGIAVDNSDNIYVADFYNNRIQKFDRNFNFVGKTDFGFDRPRDVALDNSDDLWVTDTFNHRIVKFSANLQRITSWGGRGSGDDKFNRPNGVAVDHKGNVYVADSENYTIKKFRSDTAFVTKWPDQGDDYYFFMLALDSNGNVYVSDVKFNRIIKFQLTTQTQTRQNTEVKYESFKNQFNVKRALRLPPHPTRMPRNNGTQNNPQKRKIEKRK